MSDSAANMAAHDRFTQRLVFDAARMSFESDRGSSVRMRWRIDEIGPPYGSRNRSSIPAAANRSGLYNARPPGELTYRVAPSRRAISRMRSCPRSESGTSSELERMVCHRRPSHDTVSRQQPLEIVDRSADDGASAMRRSRNRPGWTGEERYPVHPLLRESHAASALNERSRIRTSRGIRRQWQCQPTFLAIGVEHLVAVHPAASRELHTVVDHEQVTGGEEPEVTRVGNEIRLHDRDGERGGSVPAALQG